MGRASLGSVLVGLMIIGFYCFAKWEMSFQAQRLADLVKLQEKIVGGIEEPPKQPEGHFWADLRRAGVVDDQDAAILRQYGYEYVPIGPESPPDAVLFRQRQGNGYEKHVYANGSTGYERKVPSPHGKHILCDHRGAAGAKTRLVQFLSQPGEQSIGEFPIDGYERPAFWNGTGQFAVMNASLAGRKEPFTLWHVTDKQAQPILLPAELNLESLLSREIRHEDAKWGMNFIEAKRWQSARELFVYAQGVGTFTDPATKGKMGFNLIYYVVLDVQPGQCRIKSAQKHHFASSPCTSCN